MGVEFFFEGDDDGLQRRVVLTIPPRYCRKSHSLAFAADVARHLQHLRKSYLFLYLRTSFAGSCVTQNLKI